VAPDRGTLYLFTDGVTGVEGEEAAMLGSAEIEMPPGEPGWEDRR